LESFLSGNQTTEQVKPTFSSWTCNFNRAKEPLADETTMKVDYRPHSAHRPVQRREIYKPSSAPLGDRTTHRVDYRKWSAGRPASNKKPTDKLAVGDGRDILSRSRYRKDFRTPVEKDRSAIELYNEMLKRARYRPDVLPAFQDITTVRRDFRGQNGRPATNAKPRWTPAKHSKFDDKTENKV